MSAAIAIDSAVTKQTIQSTAVLPSGVPKLVATKSTGRYPLCNLYPEEYATVQYLEPSGAFQTTTTVQEVASNGALAATSGELVLRFPDGSEYRGQVRDNKPHGEGIYVRPDRSYHNGTWLYGVPNGLGNALYANGDVYKGFFKNGRRDGDHGEYISQQYKYIGGWANGCMSGRGRLEWMGTGQMYEGEFLQNRFHGPGKFMFANGSVYEGIYINGQRHGRGKLLMADGSYYVGDWRNNVAVDTAVYNDVQGNSVIGFWENGNFIPKRA